MRNILFLFLFLASPALADDVQGIFYNPVTSQFVGNTRANGMVGFKQGLTGGSSPSVGLFGYQPTATTLSTANSTYNATEAWANAGTISLGAGNWMVFVSGAGAVATLPTSGALGCDMRLQDTTNTTTLNLQEFIALAHNPLTAGDTQYFGFSMTGLRSLTAAATIAIQIGASGASGTPTNGVCTTRNAGTLYAIQMP